MRVARVGEDSQSIRKSWEGHSTDRRQEEGGGLLLLWLHATNLFVGIGT